MPVRNTISATDITNCLRGVIYKKQGKDAPALRPEIKKTLEFFSTLGDLGRQIESEIIKFWLKNDRLLNAGEFIPYTALGFTGKYDAICKIKGKSILFEIKGVGKSFFEKVSNDRLPRSYNKVQTMIYHRALLGKYPDIEPHILYVSRDEFKKGNLKSIDIPITYSDEEFNEVIKKADLVRLALNGGELPPPTPAIEFNSERNINDISMNAITCRHHALCLDDPDWYVHALQKLGRSPQELSEDEI